MSKVNEVPKCPCSQVIDVRGSSNTVHLHVTNDANKNNGNGNKDFNHAQINSNNNNNNSNNRISDVSSRLDHTKNQSVRPYQYQVPPPVSQAHQYRPPASSQPLIPDGNSSAVTPRWDNMKNQSVRPYQYQTPPPGYHQHPRPPNFGNNRTGVSPNWDNMKSQQTVQPYRPPNPVYHHPTPNIPRPNRVPFAEENDDDSEDDEYYSEYEDSEDEDSEDEDLDDEKSYYKSKKHVHVSLEQLNGRNVMTVIAGIKKKKFDYDDILEDLIELCCCNGRIAMDPDFGKVIQLRGDQRRNVRLFLVQERIVKKKKHVKIYDE